MRTKQLVKMSAYDLTKETFTFDNLSDYANGLHEYRVKAWYTASRKLLHKRTTRVFIHHSRQAVNKTLQELFGNILLEQVLVVDDVGNWARYTVCNYRCAAEREELLNMFDKTIGELQDGNSDVAIAASCVKGYAKFDEREAARWDASHLARIRKQLRKDPHAAQFGGVRWKDVRGRQWITSINPATGEIRTVLDNEQAAKDFQNCRRGTGLEGTTASGAN